MTSTIAKLAAAAVIAIAAAAGVFQLIDREQISTTQIDNEMAGPQTFKLSDGSEVTLAHGAQIRIDNASDKRGFEHVAGRIDVNVVKGKGEFVVKTPYGNVTALGTQFTMDFVDGITANTKEHVQLLAVEVTEGSVEVRNKNGSSVLKEQQKLVVEKNQAPYSMAQADDVPARLKERMNAMLSAIEAGDPKAYIANYNVYYLYKLVKGEVEYDANLFGGNEEDAKRLQQAFGNIESVEALSDAFLQGVNINEPTRVYLRDIKVSEDGKHAEAKLVTGEVAGRMKGSSPQWHYFDNDWWQVDD